MQVNKITGGNIYNTPKCARKEKLHVLAPPTFEGKVDMLAKMEPEKGFIDKISNAFKLMLQHNKASQQGNSWRLEQDVPDPHDIILNRQVFKLYSKTGTCIKESVYLKNGTLFLVRDYNPQNGNIERAVYYREDGSRFSLVDYFSTTGNRKKGIYYKKNGEIEEEIEYNPNGNGRVVRSTYYKPDGTIERREFEK